MTDKDKIDSILESDKDDKDKADHSLRAKALKRAKNFSTLNAGTPHDWEDMEKMLELEKNKDKK